MMRVSKWVQADGRVTYSKGIKNFSVRGTKYSLPLPVQGRAKDDVVLREDQLMMSKHRQVCLLCTVLLCGCVCVCVCVAGGVDVACRRELWPMCQ